MYPPLANDRLVDVLRLIRTPNVGPITFFQLLMRFGSVTEALAALPELSLRGGKDKAIKLCSISDAEREIEQAEALGARFVRYGESEYPKLLMHTNDAPPLLCIRGNSDVYSQHELVAMVGSRNASANSCQFAQKLAREVSASGIRVVSGLARGIDGYAHKGALSAGTIGVIAGGIDNIYPPEHAALYGEILEKGCIISEQPFGQAPFAGAFPSRNRIIAGMSHAILVVEASPRSGSLITARLALEYDRELMAVPGSPLDPRAKGCNQLLKQGAHMAEEAADIVQVVRSSKMHLSLREMPAAGFAPARVSESELEKAHALLMDKLSPSASAIDELVEQTGLLPAIVQGALLELELAGKVRRVPGGKVALTFRDDQEVVA